MSEVNYKETWTGSKWHGFYNQIYNVNDINDEKEDDIVGEGFD